MPRSFVKLSPARARRIRSVAVRLSTLLIGLALVMVVLTPIRAEAVPRCDRLAVSGDKMTTGNFYQTVVAFDCGTEGGVASVTASMFFAAGGGFQGSHVKACTMHVALVREGYGSLGDIPTDCTWKAQHLSSWDLGVAGGLGIRVRGAYHFTGWINIRTGVRTYNTEAQAVRVRFKTN